MTISSGVKYYYMTFNDKRYDIEDYLDNIGVTKIEEGTSSGNSNSTNNNTNSSNSSNQSNEDTDIFKFVISKFRSSIYF